MGLPVLPDVADVNGHLHSTFSLTDLDFAPHRDEEAFIRHAINLAPFRTATMASFAMSQENLLKVRVVHKYQICTCRTKRNGQVNEPWRGGPPECPQHHQS